MKWNDKDVHSMDEYHISLNICQPIKYYQIKPFMVDLKKMIRSWRYNELNCSLKGMKWFSNDPKTRYFLSMLVDNGKDIIIQMINAINGLMEQFNLLPYYEVMYSHLFVNVKQ